MLLTKECDYGLRIIRALHDNEKRTVQTICEMEYIPHKYAYKILKKLQNAGFVQNRRGPDGGYFLVKPLDSFTIYDVATAVNERLYISECLRDDKECPRNNGAAPCTVHLELARLQSLLVEEMKAKTIEELIPH